MLYVIYAMTPYGFLEPIKIFKDKERAHAYAKDISDDYYRVTVKEYELE